MTDKQKANNENPLFWYRPRSDGGYEGPLHNDQIEDVRKASGAWVPLFAGADPVSVEPVVTLNGAQLLQALDFIAPDRDTDPQQLECELTISFADGPAGSGYYCYCTDYPDEGAIMLDAEAPAAPVAAQAQPVDVPLNLASLVGHAFKLATELNNGSDVAENELRHTIRLIAAGAVQAQQEKIQALESEVSGLRAARIAYANEFPLDEEGNPDVGNIHANIRKLKGQAQQPVSGAEGVLVNDTPAAWMVYSSDTHQLKRIVTTDPGDAGSFGCLALPLYTRPSPTTALAQQEPRTDADRAAALIVEKLAEIIPLKDTLKATASGKAMIEYFTSALDQQDGDPLQGAADWLAKDCGVFDSVELASRLSIGYNRASRLLDTARKEQE